MTITLAFPSADRFVRLSILAAAAVLPVFAELDEAEWATLVEVIQQDGGATLQRYTRDDEINFPMAAYIRGHIPHPSLLRLSQGSEPDRDGGDGDHSQVAIAQLLVTGGNATKTSPRC